MRQVVPHEPGATAIVTAAAGAPCAARGFTLLEVLVALVVVALGMSALLETLTQSAQNVADLRERTVAEWIAMNQLALARLTLNAPTIGVTQGDVQNCANGNWHWQQSINAVNAIPGLMSITVRVRRTGNATNTAGPASSANGSPAGRGGNSSTAGPGATGQLGPNISLGPTAALGSITSLSTAGCASLVTAGSSLGPGVAGSPGQTSQSPGAAGPLGASSGLAGPSPGGGGSPDDSVNGPASAFGGLALGGGAASGSGSSSGGTGTGSGTGSGSSGSAGGDSSSSSSGNTQWLVTLTGFRGNTLGAAVGETPDWAGSQFAGQTGTNGVPNGSSGTTTPGNSGLPTSQPQSSPGGL